jgi:hypothetical protein
MKFRHDGPSSVLDRVCGAGVAVVYLGITVVLLPITIGGAFGNAIWIWPPPGYLSVFFVIWIGVLAVTACAMGAVLGSLRTVEFFAHMWGTESPYNEKYTNAIWFGILVVGGVTYLLGFLLPTWMT